MTYLHAILNEHFKQFDRVAVIGGLVRDFARAGRVGFRSDIDLVIEHSKKDVERLAKSLGAIENRFGGYGYRNGPWKIDFWALETTWARKYVPVERLEDIVKSTFFDWDAVAYDLWGRALISEDDYLDRISERSIEINLRPNPSPMGNLVRAVRRLMLWDSRPGPRLEEFIFENLDERALEYVRKKERELFPYSVSRSWQTVEHAKYEILTANRGKAIEQLRLFS